MGKHFLYSTNSQVKLIINEMYAKDIHFVWCSEHFDTSKVPAYTRASLVAASSDPADIYRRLAKDVRERDRHSSKIREQKLSLTNLANTWHTAGKIRSDEKDEIILYVDTAQIEEWKPLLYVIPRDVVSGRIETVPLAKRASIGPEYIIRNLRRDEFDILEF